MYALGERLDQRALDGLERDHGVAGVEHRRGRQVDLLAGLGLDGRIDVGLSDRRGRKFDAVDDQASLIAGEEVDDDTLLLQHLDSVLHRLHRLDRLRTIDTIVSGQGCGQAEDHERQSTCDHQAGDQQAAVETPLGAHRRGVGFHQNVEIVTGDRFEVVDGGVVGVGHTIGHISHDARPLRHLLRR